MNAVLVLWQKQLSKLLYHSEEMIGLLIQPVLWVVIFGWGMSSFLTPGSDGNTFSYISFVVPGIIALTALSGAIGGGTVWLEERTKGIVREYLVAPISRSSILFAHTLSIQCKTLIQVAVICLVGILMGASIKIHLMGWLGAFVLLLLYITGFAGIALSVATKTSNQGSYHMVIFIFNLPLLFLSNALYPLSNMPGWMEVAARINPTTYVIEGMRQFVFNSGMNTGSSDIALWLCFVVTGAFAAIGIFLAILTFHRSIK